MPTYDLQALVGAIGRVPRSAEESSLSPERLPPQTPSELLEENTPHEITTESLRVRGFIDGIQSTICLTYKEHRPLNLVYVAAGAIGAQQEILALKEKIYLSCSAADQQWAASLPGGFPVETFSAADSFGFESAAYDQVGSARETQEVAAVEEALARNDGVYVLDGALIGRPASARLAAVSKTVNTRYLEDETVLLSLKEGQRSPLFKIPLGVNNCTFDRYSCYVRLYDSNERPWRFGLVRVECSDGPERLDALAGLCMQERQAPGSKDPRGDRHLSSIAHVEDILRARKPGIFRVSGT